MYVPSDDRPKLHDDEYLARDLFGLSCYVLQAAGESGSDERSKVKIGIVNGVIPPDELADNSFAAQFMHPMLEVRKLPSKELCLVPLVPQIVPVINLEEDYIEINPPPGLLDLSYEEKKKRVTIRGFLPANVDINLQLRKELEIASVVVSSIPGTLSILPPAKGDKRSLRNRSRNVNTCEDENAEDLLHYDEQVTTEDLFLEKQEKERDKTKKFYS